MKNFILSAIICYSLFNTSAFAQQAAEGTVSTTRVTKTVDAGKLSAKEISLEVDAGVSDVFLDNTHRSIKIKTWKQPKVKISAKIFIDGKSTLTDEQWFDKLNLTVKRVDGKVQISSRNINPLVTTHDSLGNTLVISADLLKSVAVFDSEGNTINLGKLSNAESEILVFIPEGNKLEIDNQYSELQLTSRLQNVTIKSTGGSIEAGDINRLLVRSDYTPCVVGNVKDAEIEMEGGRLKAGNIDKLDIDSKYATIEIASVNAITLRSTSDEYEIENVGDLKGRKNYGNLRIYNLKTSIDIEGANADIRVKNLNPAVEAINIDNKYADIRLPLSNIKNYDVKFIGKFNTVYAPFEKKPLTDTNRNATSGDGSSNVSNSDAIYANGFITEVGNIKGKHTRFIINCESCTVDFK